MIIIDKAMRQPNRVISVVSESLPHLKKGAIKDFLAILEDTNVFEEDRWNRTDHTYTFRSGSKIEFFSADSAEKVRGPRRNDLFINECNRLPFETYRQLALRTDDEIWLDYNPSATFWAIEKLIPREDTDHIVVTYKDNESLPESVVEELESYKDDENFWRVYGLGLVGTLEGQIYKNWNVVDYIPPEAELIRYGLDFGYTNDPSALVAIYRYNSGFILDEIMFAKGQTNQMIAEVLLANPRALVIADSAEPKSIDDIKSYGLQVTGAAKGKDSVLNGIQLLQGQKISVTKNSLFLIEEMRNYMWKTDRDGNPLNVPEHTWSHSMDAVRYGLVDVLGGVNKNNPGRVDFMI